MKNAYVYLFRDTYTAGHIDKMEGLLAMMNRVQELEVATVCNRTDLNAFEYGLKAVTPWGMDFLEHMSLCDMIWVSGTPIESD